MNREFSQFDDEPVLKKIENEYINSKSPLKIKKTELLRELGLPIPRTDFFKRNELIALKEKVLQRITEEKRPLIIRVACVPDKFSMPDFSIDKATQIDEILAKLQNLIKKEQTITHLILQSATPKNRIKDKIVGRILYTDMRSQPAAVVIELYKGAKSAGIFNKLDIKDENYVRLEQKLGEFMKLEHKSRTISKDDTNDIYSSLKEYGSQLEKAKQIYAKSQYKTSDYLSVCFEFSYRDGNLVFVDID
jgi:hypothetical protein